MNYKEIIILALFFALLTCNTFALTVNVISEKHDLVDHEVILNIDTTQDVSAITKSWDFNWINLSTNITNFKYQVLENQVVPLMENRETKTYCINKSISADLNGKEYYCWDADITSGTNGHNKLYDCQNQIICYNSTWNLTQIGNEEKYEWKDINGIPLYSSTLLSRTTAILPSIKFPANSITTLKVNWKTPILKNSWGSNGTWAMNPTNWWNSSWYYKRDINITAPSDRNLPIWASIEFYLDTSTLITANKLLSDCNDFRLIQNDVNQLDLNVTNCNTASTKISFALPERLVPSKLLDSNFKIYYGNGSATKYNVDNNVAVDQIDGFENAGTLPPKWIIESGTYTESGAQAHSGTYSLKNNAQGWAYTLLNGTKGIRGANYSYWVDASEASYGYNFNLLDQNNSDGYPDNYVFCGMHETSGLWLRTTIATAAVDSYVAHTFSTGTWYKFKTELNYNTGIATCYAYDSSETLLHSTTGVFNSNLPIYRAKFRGDVSGTKVVYIDDLNYSPYKYNPSLASEDSNISLVNYSLTFNIYRKNTSTHLTNISMDWNQNLYDVSGQNSPFTQTVASGNYDLNVIRAGYDSNFNNRITADSNRTYTFYLTDSTAPTMGITQLNIFSTSGAYIKGTGNISATISDVGSGVDTSQCQYTINNGTTWLSADGNATHCYKNSIVISNGTTYDFNLRGKDIVGNQGTATKSSTYVGDTTAPTTTFSYTIDNNTGTAILSLSCVDAGIGCNRLTYKIDSGDYNYVDNNVTSFNYTGIGNHTITYYSSDALDNNSTPIISDLNMPVLLLIKYPMNEETLTQITEKWKLEITSSSYSIFTDLTTDKNIYVPTGVVTDLKIRDMNGNYFSRTYTKDYNSYVTTDTLQPYLVSSLTGLLTTIRTVSSYTNKPVSGITIKIYKNIADLGRTYVEEIQTDDKGEALALFVVGDSYEFEIYSNGVYIRTDAITATSATIYVQIDDITYAKPILQQIGLATQFLPVYAGLSQADNNLMQILTLNDFNTSLTIQKIYFYAWNIDVNYTKNNNVLLVTRVVDYSNQSSITNAFNLQPTLNKLEGISYDVNGYLWINVVIQTTDGNFYANKTYKPYTGYNGLYSIGYGARSFFGCTAYQDDYGNPDPFIPCPTLLFMAIMISLFATIGLAISTGFTSMQGMAGIFILIMGVFAFLTWIPPVLYAIMIAATFAIYAVRSGIL